MGDINLEFDNTAAAYDATTYQRELDLNTATVKVGYSIGEVEFTREYFASFPDQLIVSKVSANKSGSLSFTVSLNSQLPHRSSVNAQNQIVMERAENDDNSESIKFSAILDLRISDGIGTITVTEDNKIKVVGCDWGVILLAASSSFESPFAKPSDSTKNPTSEALNTLNSVKDFSYEQLYTRHLDDYQKLFHRVSIDLSKTDSEDVTENMVATSERVKSFKTDEDTVIICVFHVQDLELSMQTFRVYGMIKSHHHGSKLFHSESDLFVYKMEIKTIYIVLYIFSVVHLT